MHIFVRDLVSHKTRSRLTPHPKILFLVKTLRKAKSGATMHSTYAVSPPPSPFHANLPGTYYNTSRWLIGRCSLSAHLPATEYKICGSQVTKNDSADFRGKQRDLYKRVLGLDRGNGREYGIVMVNIASLGVVVIGFWGVYVMKDCWHLLSILYVSVLRGVRAVCCVHGGEGRRKV